MKSRIRLASVVAVGLLVVLISSWLSPIQLAYADPGFENSAINVFRSALASGTSNPKNRVWGGVGWATLSTQMATAGSPVRWVRVAYCTNETRYYERIAVTLSDDGNLDAYVWRGSSWSVTLNIGSVGVTANAYRPFDIAYEKTTGRAMLVYGINSADVARDLAYQIWDGATWSAEAYINDGTAAVDIQYNWVAMASKPASGSNEIVMAAISAAADSDANAWVWSGTAWGNFRELTAASGTVTTEAIAVSYEQLSGFATAVYSTGDATSLQWSGAAWDVSGLGVDLTGASAPAWFTLKADPVSDKLMLTAVDGATDLNTAEWSGAAWTLHGEHDNSVDSAVARCADFEWEPTGSKGLLVYGDGSNGQITRKTYTSPGTFSAATPVVMGTGPHPWVQLRRNPNPLLTTDIKILGAVLEGTANDLGAIKWDGTTFTIIGASTFTTNTEVSTYESFEIEFQNFLHQLPRFSVVPASQSVAGAFNIKVNITWGYDVYSWEWNITYDTTKITATSVTEGAFLSAGGTTQFNKTINDAKGWVWSYASLLGDVPGVTGNGTLAQVSFSPDASGTSTLDVHNSKLVEYDYATKGSLNYGPTLPLKVIEIDGSVTISAVPEFPFGAALELGLVGVIIYVWWIRKSKTKPFKTRCISAQK